MILLDRNNKPTNTVYYLAAVIYGLLLHNENMDYIKLYNRTQLEINNDPIELSFFSLALDFLFLSNMLNIDKRGNLYVYKKFKNNK